MNLVRYAVSKKDLHELLRMMGVLQKGETLHAVSGADLADPREEMVVITVLQNVTEPPPSKAFDAYTERELSDRYVLLTLLDKALVEERPRIEAMLAQIRKLLMRRGGAPLPGIPGMPRDVDEALSRQIRDILDHSPRNGDDSPNDGDGA